MNVTAVMTFVRLAIDRWSWELASQMTSPVCGLNTMAAAARTSGTRLPSRSRLKRGVIASSCSRAAAALRAAAARRARSAAAARARARLERVCGGLAAWVFLTVVWLCAAGLLGVADLLVEVAC